MTQVLIVEDAREVAHLLAEAFELEGFETIVCHDGEAAIARLSQLGDAAVMVLDLRLPKVSGWQVLDAARAARPKLPVVVVSAEPDARVAGADACLPKPFDLDELIGVTRRLAA